MRKNLLSFFKLREHGIVPAISIALPAVKDADMPPPKLSTVITPQGKIKLKALRLGSKPKPKEAMSASSMPQLVRGPSLQAMKQALTKRLKKKVSECAECNESNRLQFVVKKRFKESDAAPNAAPRYEVVLICEGLGNIRDGFYYPGDTLINSAALFEGQKCFANHPSSAEEVVLPERDVRDIVGHFENIKPITNGDHVELQGELVLMQGPSYDWVKSQLDHALQFSGKYQDKDFVGLSINAGGEADPIPVDTFLMSYSIPESCRPKIVEAQMEGLSQVRVVNKITEAVSCDLVTQAGAGGRIVQAI